jgi:hypothetical protein
MAIEASLRLGHESQRRCSRPALRATIERVCRRVLSCDENLYVKHGETCRRSFNSELSPDLSTELSQPVRSSGVIAPAAQITAAGALKTIPFVIQTSPE